MAIGAVLTILVMYGINSFTDKPKSKVTVVDCPVCEPCTDTSVAARERARMHDLLKTEDLKPAKYCTDMYKVYWLLYAYTCYGNINCLTEVKYDDK